MLSLTLQVILVSSFLCILFAGALFSLQQFLAFVLTLAFNAGIEGLLKLVVQWRCNSSFKGKQFVSSGFSNFLLRNATIAYFQTTKLIGSYK